MKYNYYPKEVREGQETDKQAESVFERRGELEMELEKEKPVKSETSEHGKEAGLDPSKDWKALQGTEHTSAPLDASLQAKGKEK